MTAKRKQKNSIAPIGDRLLTLREAAEVLRLNPRTVREYVGRGAVMQVLQRRWDPTFSEHSHGFRPKRSAHQAVAKAQQYIAAGHPWVVDLDLERFFGTISHEWLGKFIEHRIADRRILRLIRKWLRAGVSEEGAWAKTEVGTPQGAVVSPLLANVYLHYAFDLWAQHWRKHRATGEVIIVRYADNRLGVRTTSRCRAFPPGMEGTIA